MGAVVVLKIRLAQLEVLSTVPRTALEAALADRLAHERRLSPGELPSWHARVHAIAGQARHHGLLLADAIERYVRAVLGGELDLRPSPTMQALLADPGLPPQRKLERLELLVAAGSAEPT